MGHPAKMMSLVGPGVPLHWPGQHDRRTRFGV